MGNKRIPIAAKLLGGFGIVLAFVAVLGWVSITRMGSIDQGAQTIFEEDLESIVLMSQIEEEALDVEVVMTKGVLATLMANEILATDPVLAEELGHEAELLLGEAGAEAADVTHLIEELLLSGHLHGESLILGEELEHNWQIFLLEIEEVQADEAAGLAFAVGLAVLSGEGEEAFAAAITEIDALRAAFEHEAELTAASANSTYTSARTLTLILIAAAIGIGSGIGLYLSRSISGNVSKISRGLTSISEGRLDEQVTVKSNDELGDMGNAYAEMQSYLTEMAETADGIADGDLTAQVRPRSDDDRLGVSFRSMIANLRDVIGGAGEAAAHLVVAKDQLAAASQQAAEATNETAKTTSQVAEGTAQQATAVQEVAAGIERLNDAADQLDAKARTDVAEAAVQMAEGARAASDGAREASETAQSGANMVQQTVDGIGRIQTAVEGAAQEVTGLGAQSEEIGKIVAVIEDIAAQTNLLALNAAIEAARAGEQGRGFAVVADEVRQLAERVASATKEIATLIEGVQNSVEASVKAMEQGTTEMGAGSEAAAEAAVALTAILSAVDAATGQIQDIASRSDELKSASEEMVQLVDEVKSVASSASESVSQIASVAEENSAATEQVSAASEQMSAQVEQVSASAASLGELADGLRDRVAAFRLDAGPAQAAPGEAGHEPTPA